MSELEKIPEVGIDSSGTSGTCSLMNELGVCTIVPSPKIHDIVGPKSCEAEVTMKKLKDRYGKDCPPLPEGCKLNLGMNDCSHKVIPFRMGLVFQIKVAMLRGKSFATWQPGLTPWSRYQIPRSATSSASRKKVASTGPGIRLSKSTACQCVS